MIISESKWRKRLGLPYISVQPEWVEELCERRDQADQHNNAVWTSTDGDYRWSERVHDWLFESGGRWSLERCYASSDFATGQQARIWFRSMKHVTLFKLTFGGQTRPKIMGFGIQKQVVNAKSRKLNATWTWSPPSSYY